MRTLLRLMLSDLNIPFEEIDDLGPTVFDEQVKRYCIPDYNNAVAVITCWGDSEFDLHLDNVTLDGNMEGLTEREVVEYLILYLLQRNSELLERVPYTPLYRNDPEHLIAGMIEDASVTDEPPDMTANKIVTYGLLFNIRKLVDEAVKEITYEYRRED